jgi:peptide-methionine (R)-S-oxide reductase
MRNRLKLFTSFLFFIQMVSCQENLNTAKDKSTSNEINQKKISNNMDSINAITISEDEWKKKLTPEQFYILREKGTERAWTGKYNTHFENGVYVCAGCGLELFKSESKFESHCGWPSFDNQIQKSNIITKSDFSHGMIRTEIICGRCGGHLGHVFNDGPTKTGLRYCVNSVSIEFEKEK